MVNSPPGRRWRRRLAVAGSLLLAAGLGLRQGWSRWLAEGAALGRAHATFQTSHPGWSFPARIVSRALPLEALSPKRRVAEAKVRGYLENCWAKELEPGTYCEKLPEVRE